MTSLTVWGHAFNKLKHNRLAIFSFLTILFYGALVLLASSGLIATDFHIANNNNAYAPPSSQFWLGTDFLGRSVLSRVIQGTRVAFVVGFFSASLASLIGLTLGSLAGYFGGLVDDFVVWLYTTVDSIPYILLISAFAFSLGQGINNLYLALGFTGWVRLCRLIRGEVIRNKSQEYVRAAQAIGASHFQRLVKHIIPNVLHITFVQFSLSFVAAIKLEVILSYLGLGVEPGTPSWGMMINDAQIELARGIWWNLIAATGFMFFLILSVNLFTDALRTALDPKLKSR